MKTVEVSNVAGDMLIECPGCGCAHVLSTVTPNGNGALWGYNGNPNRPTFTPSLLVSWPGGYGEDYKLKVCHSYITDGYIEFLSDSTHELAGKTVELPNFRS